MMVFDKEEVKKCIFVFNFANAYFHKDYDKGHVHEARSYNLHR